MKKLLLTSAALLSVSCFSDANAGSNEIAQLRAQIQALSARLNAMEKKAAAAPVATPAVQTDSGAKHVVVSRNDKVKLTFGGQVSVASGLASNGKEWGGRNVTNHNSTSRIELGAEGKISDESRAKLYLNLGYGPYRSMNVGMRTNYNEYGAGQQFFEARRAEVAFENDRIGTLYIGKGPSASDHSSEVDYSGTYLATAWYLTGGMQFVQSGAKQGSDLGPCARFIYDHMDGNNRTQRLRYDTPVFSGFQVRTSAESNGSVYGPKNSYDGAIFFSGTASGYKFGAAVAALKKNGDTVNAQGVSFDQYNGSASVKMPCGLSFSASTGIRRFRQMGVVPHATTYFGKVGYEFDAVEWGPTIVSADYGVSHNISPISSMSQGIDARGTGKLYGLVLMQKLPRVSTEVFLTWRGLSFDAHKLNTRKYKKLSTFLLGARLKF